MKVSDIDLRRMITFAPDMGQVFLGKDRMLIFRQDSIAVLRKLLHEQVGEALAHAILSRFGYQCGYGDFASLQQGYAWDSEQDRFGAGPAMHAWEGIVHVEPTSLEFDRTSGHFHMKGIWRNSYEAQIHLAEMGPSKAPVCHSLTGYASGWCTAFFGKTLLAIETKCMGKGDPRCEFEIQPWDAWGNEAELWKKALESTEYSLSRELEKKIALVEQQAMTISQLSTPIMEIWEDVLVLPIVGVVDTKRSAYIVTNLLERIVSTQSRCVILDVTGVEVVDTNTADHLLQMVRAAGLLGTQCVLTGLSPAIARTLVDMGANLGTVKTLRTLKEGLEECLRYLDHTRDHARVS